VPVSGDPPYLVAGDLNDKIEDVAALAPDDATLVIFHTSVLGYLDAAGRSAFTAKVRDLPGHWISNEIPAAVAFGSLPPLPDPTRLMSVLAQDGRPVAYAGTNGQDLPWFT
jgi:hypothetical protein